MEGTEFQRWKKGTCWEEHTKHNTHEISHCLLSRKVALTQRSLLFCDPMLVMKSNRPDCWDQGCSALGPSGQAVTERLRVR